MLHEQIKSGIKDAMMAKDTIKLETLRAMVAGFTNELVAKGKNPNEMLGDEEALAVITRLSKQRKDSIEQFTNAKRLDLAGKESEELEILKSYLPAQMSLEEIKTIVNNTISEVEAKTLADMGRIMGAIIPKIKGKADAGLVSKIVKEELSK